MPTKQELFDHIKKHLDLTIQDDPLWSSIAAAVQLGNRDPIMLATSLSNVYLGLVKKEPTLAVLTDELFKKLILFNVARGDTFAPRTLGAKNLFRAWTQHGTRDISDQDADELKEPLRHQIDDSDNRNEQIMTMIFYSKNLWARFESLLMDLAQENIHCKVSIRHQGVLPDVIHRHSPHLTHLFDHSKKEDFYYSLCGGHYNDTPPLHRMSALLLGHHHNAYAWNTAIKICTREHSMNGQWMAMLPAFSSLSFDPKDQDSWQLWHLLCERTQNDGSGRDLMIALSEANPPISQAFKDIWGITDSLYQGPERYKRAAALYPSNATTTPENTITLPQMDTLQLYNP